MFLINLRNCSPTFNHRHKKIQQDTTRNLTTPAPEVTREERGTEMKYDVMRMFADGVERKRTLSELAREIQLDNPDEIVEIISEKTGLVWCGKAKNILSNLTGGYVKRCVQELSIDEYGITLVMR